MGGVSRESLLDDGNLWTTLVSCKALNSTNWKDDIRRAGESISLGDCELFTNDDDDLGSSLYDDDDSASSFDDVWLERAELVETV